MHLAFIKKPLISVLLSSIGVLGVFSANTYAAKNTEANKAASVANEKTTPVYDAELNGYDYPYPVKTFEFPSQLQAVKMRYMDIGEKSADNIAVLLHGKNFTSDYWQTVAELLVSQGYRVIMPDQIGFGKSTKPELYQYSFAQLALNTQSLLDSIGIRHYTVVGHSMGGMLATTMALNYADKIDKLILINPIGLEPYLDYVAIKDPLFFYETELRKTPEQIREYQKANYYDGQWNDHYEALIKPLIGWINGPDKKRIAWNNALTYSPIFAEDITSRFPKLRVPTRLIIGTRDRTGPGRNWKKPGVTHKLGQYPELAKAAEEAIPDAKLYPLEGLGHLPHIEDFEKFKPAFLDAIKDDAEKENSPENAPAKKVSDKQKNSK